jgi:hypothetical protein
MSRSSGIVPAAAVLCAAIILTSARANRTHERHTLGCLADRFLTVRGALPDTPGPRAAGEHGRARPLLRGGVARGVGCRSGGEEETGLRRKATHALPNPAVIAERSAAMGGDGAEARDRGGSFRGDRGDPGGYGSPMRGARSR